MISYYQVLRQIGQAPHQFLARKSLTLLENFEVGLRCAASCTRSRREKPGFDGWVAREFGFTPARQPISQFRLVFDSDEEAFDRYLQEWDRFVAELGPEADERMMAPREGVDPLSFGAIQQAYEEPATTKSAYYVRAAVDGFCFANSLFGKATPDLAAFERWLCCDEFKHRRVFRWEAALIYQCLGDEGLAAARFFEAFEYFSSGKWRDEPPGRRNRWGQRTS